MTFKHKNNPFQEWIDSGEESCSSFSRRTHISYITVLKAYHGESIRIDTARRMVRYSKKKNSKKQLTLKDFGFEDDSKSTGLPEGK